MEETDEFDLEINMQTECKYHLLLNLLQERIYGRFEEHYDWNLFDYWFGDDSNFGNIYRQVFALIFALHFHEHLTQEQTEIIEKKGRNLEDTVSKWLRKWKADHPNLTNEKMPLSCIKQKMYEYIAYQLKQKDIRLLIGNPC